jgi:hypothetical protein
MNTGTTYQYSRKSMHPIYSSARHAITLVAAEGAYILVLEVDGRPRPGVALYGGILRHDVVEPTSCSMKGDMHLLHV